MQGDNAKTFSVAAKEFFGLREEQDLKGFVEELKALTVEDKREIADGLRQNGYLIKEF